jgi:formylglycine-generating enzyme required for sulfatase activity
LTSAKAVAAGVAHLGLAGGDLAAAGCPDTGNGCVSVYAVSIAGVAPAAFITWFQAAAAARNSLKRLPTNQEWQAAALGTPDGAPCNVISGSLANTGSASGCVSDVGAFDMVGNVYEWVADWVSHLSTNCLTGSLFGTGDDNCLNGLGVASTTDGPGAMARGGDGFFSDAFAGVFAIGNASPSTSSFNTGFRAVR